MEFYLYQLKVELVLSHFPKENPRKWDNQSINVRLSHFQGFSFALALALYSFAKTGGYVLTSHVGA